MKNGDIQNFKLSNSCSAGNGMLLQAMADQFGIPVTEYAETAFKAELAPKFSYGCAVFLDSDRVNFQKEGYQKEELLAGLAQVLPKNVWQYVVQIPRLASLGRKFVLQGGTQYNLAAVKAQVDYIKQRVPGAEVFVHPHTGEAGAIGAAIETLRRYKRSGKTRLHRHGGFARSRVHDQERREHRLSLLSERVQAHVHRHCAPRRLVRSLHLRLLLREGHGREQRRDDVADGRAQERRPRTSRTWSITSRSARSCTSTTPRRCRPRARSIEDVRVKKGLFRVQREKYTRPFRRSSAEATQAPQGDARGHAARAEHVLHRAVLPYLLRGGGHRPFEHRVQRRTPPRRSGSRAASTARSIRAYPSKVVQAHIHNLLFHKHEPERNRQLNYIFFPILTHVTELRGGHAGQRLVSDRRRHTGRDEGRLHQGGRLLRPARHRVPRPGAVIHRAEPARAAHVRGLGRAPRHHRGRERPRLPRGLEGARRLRQGSAGQGPRDPGDGRSRRSDRDPGAQSPVSRRSRA